MLWTPFTTSGVLSRGQFNQNFKFKCFKSSSLEVPSLEYEETKHPEANLTILKMFLSLFCLALKINPLLPRFIAMSCWSQLL